MVHAVLLVPQFLHRRRDICVVLFISAADQSLPSGIVPPMRLWVAARLVWQRRLEALEQRELIVVFGDVGEEVVGYVCQRSLLDLGDGYSRPHKLARGGLGEGEDRPLQHWPAQLAVQLSQGILIVLTDALGADQAPSGRRHLFAKSLQVAGLAQYFSITASSEGRVGKLHQAAHPAGSHRRRRRAAAGAVGSLTCLVRVSHRGQGTRPCAQRDRATRGLGKVRASLRSLCFFGSGQRSKETGGEANER